MKRHRSHQIDERAQRAFREALPPMWVANEHRNDYGKDYLIEIGENNGELTGSSFYVQLKGQEKARRSADGTTIKFSLETKYATYYLDKIKDLPVFLVVVDVNQKRGWFEFLQPFLHADQSWRKRKSVTIDIPILSDIANSAVLRRAVESAKQFMRLLHPEAIQDAVAANKRRMKALDPRFDISVALDNDKPVFRLIPLNPPVSITMTFLGQQHQLEPKLTDLLDKGALVEFRPGEVEMEGSKLLEKFNETGGALQFSMDQAGSLLLTGKDGEGRTTGSLLELPGRLTGGKKELWFRGGLEQSPLTVTMGPFSPNIGGALSVDLRPAKWEGQRLLHLAYFDAIYQFVQDLRNAKQIEVAYQQLGNRCHLTTSALQSSLIPESFADYIVLLHKARKVAERFAIDPVWTLQAFDIDSRETAQQLYGVFFEDGWREATPSISFPATLERRTFRFECVEPGKPVWVRIVASVTASMLNETFDVGPLIREFSDVTLAVSDQTKGENDSLVEVVATGSPETVMTIRKAGPGEQTTPAELPSH
jgi:hypothetical protein